MMQALRQPMLTLAILLLPSVAVGSPVAEDPTGLGPYAVTSQEYRLEAEIDELVLTDRPISYWAVVWSPTDAPADGRLPLTVFLHGNHATCGTGENPRRDTNSYVSPSDALPNAAASVYVTVLPAKPRERLTLAPASQAIHHERDLPRRLCRCPAASRLRLHW